MVVNGNRLKVFILLAIHFCTMFGYFTVLILTLMKQRRTSENVTKSKWIIRKRKRKHLQPMRDEADN